MIMARVSRAVDATKEIEYSNYDYVIYKLAIIFRCGETVRLLKCSIKALVAFASVLIVKC